MYEQTNLVELRTIYYICIFTLFLGRLPRINWSFWRQEAKIRSPLQVPPEVGRMVVLHRLPMRSLQVHLELAVMAF